LKKSLASGVLPHWSAFLGCGEPFLADIERAVLYPANVIYLLLPTGTATVVSAVFHVLLGGVGTYGLSRAWGVSRMGALVAAVVFAFNSFMVTRIEYCSARASLAWVPIVLLTFTAWLSSRGLRRLLLMAGALCLQFLAGYPESTFFTVCILVVYALFAGLAEWRVRRKWFCLFAPVLAVGASGLLAVLLSMAQFLPTWEAVQVSGRSGPVDPELDTQSLPPAALFSLLLPSIYGSPDLYWAPSCCHYNLGAFYVGVLPVVLFVMAAGATQLLEHSREQLSAGRRPFWGLEAARPGPQTRCTGRIAAAGHDRSGGRPEGGPVLRCPSRYARGSEGLRGQL